MQIPVVFFIVVLIILIVFLGSKKEQLTLAPPDPNDPCAVKQNDIHYLCWPYYSGKLCENKIREYNQDCGEFIPFS